MTPAAAVSKEAIGRVEKTDSKWREHTKRRRGTAVSALRPGLQRVP